MRIRLSPDMQKEFNSLNRETQIAAGCMFFLVMLAAWGASMWITTWALNYVLWSFHVDFHANMLLVAVVWWLGHCVTSWFRGTKTV